MLTKNAIIEKVFSGNIKSIEETFRILNRAEAMRAARLIADTERLVFFGMGLSNFTRSPLHKVSDIF